MMALITTALQAITALCNLGIALIKYKLFTYEDTTENEIEHQLNLHTPAGDQRAAILSERLKQFSVKPVSPP